MAISIRWAETAAKLSIVSPQEKPNSPEIIHTQKSKQPTSFKKNKTLTPPVLPSNTAAESTDQAIKTNDHSAKENQNTSTFDIKDAVIKSAPRALLNDNTDNEALIKQSASSQGSQQASPLSGSIPKYPRNAIRREQEGRVVVSLTVNVDGRTSDVKIMHSSGYYLLDKAVLRFVKHEEFHPASQNNTPYTSKQEFAFVFILSP